MLCLICKLYEQINYIFLIPYSTIHVNSRVFLSLIKTQQGVTKIMKDIRKFSKNKITLDEVQTFFHIEDYSTLVDTVTRLINEGSLRFIKASGLNGKKPGLYLSYQILREKENNEEWIKELRYMVPELDGDYYLRNLDRYKEDRPYIIKLNNYLKKNKGKLNIPISINERSFEIFGQEKFLLISGGKKLLSKLNYSFENLNCYETSQPLAYYSYRKDEGQILLIIENKDTFYSMRKHLLEGNSSILGVQVGTLIYGGGKAIYRSISDFEYCMEPYMRSDKNHILYFGDLDFEGILIYEKVEALMKPDYQVKPFINAYEKMIEKAEFIELPKSKELQNKNCGDIFFSYFEGDIRLRMKELLGTGDYIPQEIFQIADF